MLTTDQLKKKIKENKKAKVWLFIAWLCMTGLIFFYQQIPLDFMTVTFLIFGSTCTLILLIGINTIVRVEELTLELRYESVDEKKDVPDGQPQSMQEKMGE